MDENAAAEEVGRAVLARLGDAKRAPVSARVLAKWDEGEFSMHDAQRRRLIKWLNAEAEGRTYEEAAQAAVEIMEGALEKMRALLPKRVRAPAKTAGDLRAVRGAKRSRDASRKGHRKVDGE